MAYGWSNCNLLPALCVDNDWELMIVDVVLKLSVVIATSAVWCWLPSLPVSVVVATGKTNSAASPQFCRYGIPGNKLPSFAGQLSQFRSTRSITFSYYWYQCLELAEQVKVVDQCKSMM